MAGDEQEAKAWVRGVFTRAADLYDRVGPATFAHWGRRLVEVAALSPGASVLDVATGRGAVLIPAAEAVGSDGSVVGVDLVLPMVQVAAEALRSQGFSNAQVLLMDAETLAFRDASFGHVLCGFGLFLFPRPDRALSEFARVLAPGGRVAVTAVGQFATLEASGEPTERFKHLFDEYAQISPGLRAYQERERRWPSPVEVWTAEGLEKAFKSSGFGDPRIWWEEAEFVFASPDEWWNRQWSHWRRAILESLEAEILERFKGDVFTILAQVQRPDGIHARSKVLFGLATRQA